MLHGNKNSDSIMENRRTTIVGLLAVALFLIGYAASYAQPVGEKNGPQFPFLTSSARGAGIGDATAALIDDFSGFGSNPGTLGLMKKSVVDYATQRIQQGVTFEHLGLSYKATGVDVIAFGIDILHYGGLDFYSKDTIRKLGFEMRTGIAYSRQLGEQFSLGINLQALTSTTGINTVWGFATDIGFTYAPGKYIRYGAVLKGIGSDYDVPSQILPTDYFDSRIQKVLALGIVIDYPFADRTQKVLVAVQNEKILGEAILIYKLGVEYFPLWSQTIRAGFRTGFVIREPEVQPRLGLGVGYSRFALDYAYSYTRRYSQPSHLFTISFAW